jgi:hypothetical protein
VLERVDELLGEASMGDQYDSDHLIPKSFVAVMPANENPNGNRARLKTPLSPYYPDELPI